MRAIISRRSRVSDRATIQREKSTTRIMTATGDNGGGRVRIVQLLAPPPSSLALFMLLPLFYDVTAASSRLEAIAGAAGTHERELPVFPTTSTATVSSAADDASDVRFGNYGKTILSTLYTRVVVSVNGDRSMRRDTALPIRRRTAFV